MKTNLVLNLHCSECGAQLEFVRNCKTKEEHIRQRIYKDLGGFIPSDAVAIPAQFVAPCKSCINKVIEPSQKFIEALKLISEHKS